MSMVTTSDTSFEAPLSMDDSHDSNHLSLPSIDTPVACFLENLLNDAIAQSTSDIHFEPGEAFYRIRFRRDGLLRTVSELPCKLAAMITARLKILSQLDISERRVPQDGRFSLPFSQQSTIDFRISTCPTLHGEKIVLRLLTSDISHLKIAALGMSHTQEKLFLRILGHSQGMILVTGPTGSGKTTTLYTALNHINTHEKNICTVEDPVEIQLPGVNQVPVNNKTGLTFARVLRAFLRQDPDVLMVGEIRDLETAKIAINAAQTGHLVLSTLHTNSACETIIRLANMGIPTYNIASAISLIVAQRLVRRLCEHCKEPQKAIESIEANLVTFEPSKNTCPHCHNGYRGRLAIFEVLFLSEDLKNLIVRGESSNALRRQAEREEIALLRQAGLQHVRAGHTSLSEINRIINL